MNCIKCGVEIKEPQVFCDSCLADMEKYPVKPNITVNLPVRPAAASGKKRTRRQKYTRPEELIRHLRVKLRILWFAVVMLLIAFGLVSVMLFRLLEEQDSQYEIGENYGSMSSTEPS